MSIDLFIELAALSPQKFDSSLLDCFSQIPNLLTNPTHLLRLFDTYALVLVQLPHHVMAAITYLDMGTLISRIRKLNGLLQRDLDTCIDFARMYHFERPNETTAHLSVDSTRINDNKSHRIRDESQQDYLPNAYKNMNSNQKQALNESLGQSIYMARMINNEFNALKRTITAYLDLLLIGSGFGIAVAVSAFINAETRLIRLIIMLAIFSCSTPLVICSVFCMAVEAMVSMVIFGLDLFTYRQVDLS